MATKVFCDGEHPGGEAEFASWQVSTKTIYGNEISTARTVDACDRCLGDLVDQMAKRVRMMPDLHSIQIVAYGPS